MILITGGNGYIGTALSEILISRGLEFRIMDNLSGSSPLNLTMLNGRAEFFWGDVRSPEDVEKAARDSEVVIHLAAKLPTTPGMLDEVKEEVRDVNVVGTKNVLEVARKVDAKVIFASTCNVYGIGEDLKEDSEVKPLNPYSESKLEAEKLCLEYHENYGLDVKILRLASVYGYSYGVRFNLVVNYFVLRALMNYPLTVFGDGSNWRPFVHVKDAAKAFLHFVNNGKPGEIYNVGGENYRIRDVAELVVDTVNRVKVEFIYEIKPEFSYSVNFTKIKKEGFECDYSMIKGIKELSDRIVELRKYRR